MALGSGCIDTSSPPDGSSGGTSNAGGHSGTVNGGGLDSMASGGDTRVSTSLGSGGTSFDAGLCPNCTKYCQCETAIEKQAGILKYNCSVIDEDCLVDPQGSDQGCQAQLQQLALSASVPAECL
jgi:hypothetical protein